MGLRWAQVSVGKGGKGGSPKERREETLDWLVVPACVLPAHYTFQFSASVLSRRKISLLLFLDKQQ